MILEFRWYWNNVTFLRNLNLKFHIFDQYMTSKPSKTVCSDLSSEYLWFSTRSMCRARGLEESFTDSWKSCIFVGIRLKFLHFVSVGFLHYFCQNDSWTPQARSNAWNFDSYYYHLFLKNFENAYCHTIDNSQYDLILNNSLNKYQVINIALSCRKLVKRVAVW